MGGSTKHQQSQALRRQLAIVWQLALHPSGMTRVQLERATEVPKSSFHRYLKGLDAADVAIDRACVNGETRYSLAEAVLASLTITDIQRTALIVARRKLGSLEGAHVTQALDELIKLAKRGHQLPKQSIQVRKTRAIAPDHLETIDRAFNSGRRLVIRYRGSKDRSPRSRRVEPVAVRNVGDAVYLHAFDVDHGDMRTFKLDRISHTEVTRERAEKHAWGDADVQQSVKAWVGEPVAIVVRLHADVARYAHEYSVVDEQTVEDQPDGSVLIRATVNGILEPMRWVLSWGKGAEALEPKALRDVVADQVLGAASLYRLPVGSRFIAPSSTTQVAAKKSKRPRSTSLTDRGTAAE